MKNETLKIYVDFKKLNATTKKDYKQGFEQNCKA